MIILGIVLGILVYWFLGILTFRIFMKLYPPVEGSWHYEDQLGNQVLKGVFWPVCLPAYLLFLGLMALAGVMHSGLSALTPLIENTCSWFYKKSNNLIDILGKGKI